MVKKYAESPARYYLREQAKKRGWNIAHPARGGDILEEQEISGYFADIGLGRDRPDFLLLKDGLPTVVVETKNNLNKIDQAVLQAIEYANAINASSPYTVKFAVGSAGEEDCGFAIEVRYLIKNQWKPLISYGHPLTNLPTKKEVDAALIADDSTTHIEIPSISEFIDAAIALSRTLRTARVEAPLRPKVIGALVLAMYQGNIDLSAENALNSINNRVSEAIAEFQDLAAEKKLRFEECLKLTGADFDRLSPRIASIVHLLNALNVRAVLRTDTDFLGLFYEAFLRYGYDNNALGIVFTPRHITRFCVELLDVKATDKVIDIACGTGGFLVSAFDRMMSRAVGARAISKVKNALYGFDTNPTIWALATLNMLFRGDGKSHIENKSCLEPSAKKLVADQFQKAFLNPPFSQDEEPERDFINTAMNALEPEGLLATVVKAGIFADDDNKAWRREFTRNHSVLGIISLPDDLFYPTAAPTSILIAKAHVPQSESAQIFMARIDNDGYTKLKGRRVEISGSELPAVVQFFQKFMEGKKLKAKNVSTVNGKCIIDGGEWSPQEWLPHPVKLKDGFVEEENSVRFSIYRAVTIFPELADIAVKDFTRQWENLPQCPVSQAGAVADFFHVHNGKSSGEKNYIEGVTPYISSGGSSNSIIRLVDSDEAEIFPAGAITVTAFGQAYIQPWPFMARGNGGSSVRVLIPKYKMCFNDLVWFAAQINAQRWRFFYARMAIKSRLVRLVVTSRKNKNSIPCQEISQSIAAFRDNLLELSGAV